MTVSTGLSDFHKMIITVMKTTFPKAEPKIVIYRDYKNFIENDFRNDLREGLQKENIKDYGTFENIFLEVLHKHAPPKKKILRANHKPYMTKVLRKAIMRRSALANKYLKEKSDENKKMFRKQKNFTNKLMKKEKKKFFRNLDLNKFTDNKAFWNTVKPLFSNNGGGSRKITLVKDDDIISNDEDVAEAFNQFFKNSVDTLDINENLCLMNDTTDLNDPVKIALKKFENHPSVNDIKKTVNIDLKFSFVKVNCSQIEVELKSLKTKKASTFLNIPTKHVKQVIDIILQPLVQIFGILR